MTTGCQVTLIAELSLVSVVGWVYMISSSLGEQMATLTGWEEVVKNVKTVVSDGGLLYLSQCKYWSF